ncbi:MAG: carbohydrate ABC transporter permease [Christensenellales bacterium]|jgi:putative aldouronate transport system permease protein
MTAKTNKTRNDSRFFDVINTFLLVLILISLLYPLYFTIIASISEPSEVVKGNVVFWPNGFTLESYQMAFNESRIWMGYRNSLIYTVLGTLFNLFLTIPAGYFLSKKELPGRQIINIYFLITMYFSGGLIPTYLIVKSFGLLDQWFTLIILSGISIYNTVITRVYFQSSLPNELYEAAYIDGASDFRTFFVIALPLAKPIIAVIALYYSVGHWNGYFNALVYVSKQSLQPLQIVLRSILLMNEQILSAIDPNTLDAEMVVALTRRAYLASTMKYALIFIASAPLLIAYPFVQKHFVKGALIGSLKG